MPFAICNEIFQNWKLADAFAYAAKVGYDALEIAPFTLAKDVTHLQPGQRREIRELAQRSGVCISGIHWVLAQTEGLHVSHPDRSIRERTSAYLVELVNFCADIGGRFMVVGSPKQRNILPGIAREQAWDWATSTFQPASHCAEKRGVTICFEPLAPAETNFINTAAEAIRFAQQFQRPSFKIILDVKAMSSEGIPVDRIIRESWPHFAYFHANDTNLQGPGFGETDFRPIAAALKQVGYSGYISVEVFKFDEGPEVIASQSIAYLRRVFA
jgi:sugar phosphate isomerase/epimerase